MGLSWNRIPFKILRATSWSSVSPSTWQENCPLSLMIYLWNMLNFHSLSWQPEGKHLLRFLSWWSQDQCVSTAEYNALRANRVIILSVCMLYIKVCSFMSVWTSICARGISSTEGKAAQSSHNQTFWKKICGLPHLGVGENLHSWRV